MKKKKLKFLEINKALLSVSHWTITNQCLNPMNCGSMGSLKMITENLNCFKIKM